MFLYICENKRPDRTGENPLHYYLKTKPPNNRRIDDTQKEIPTAAKEKTKIRSLGMWTRSFFSFRTARRKKKAVANNDTNDNNNNTQEAIRTTSAKSLNPGSRGKLSR